MCLARLLGAAVAALTILAAAASANPAISLQVAADQAEYMVGEPVFVTLTFRGESDETTTIDLGHLARWTFTATFAGETTRSGLLQSRPGGISMIYRADLRRGETYTHRMLLSEWVCFRTPGTHSVAITYDSSRAFHDAASELLAVAELTVRVVPKDSAKLSELLRRYYEHRAVEEDTLAICYSGQDEALPFLKDLARKKLGKGSGLLTEIHKGIRHVGTPKAVELMAEFMGSDDEYTRYMAMVEIRLLHGETTDAAIKARLAQLVADIPSDFRGGEPAVCD